MLQAFLAAFPASQNPLAGRLDFHLQRATAVGTDLTARVGTDLPERFCPVGRRWW